MAGVNFLLDITLLYLLFHLASSQDDYSDPVVNILTGRVSGLKEDTPAGNQFYKFLGIPYAEIPIGVLRFKDPVVKKAWSGLLNATEFPTACIQRTYTTPVTLTGSEDCLYLNIFTPSLPKPGYTVSKSLKPVMFWIHGGGFTEADGTMDPALLLDQDVLVVSVNYRLGPFGFLALEGNPDLAGNIGLKDQQEALQWVNKNIMYFGGDPAKVTLFGVSAGAVSVHAHVLSPRIQNIFQGAILQSGTVLMKYVPTLIDKEVQKSSQKLVEKINCNVPDVLECLHKQDTDILMELSENNTLAEAEEERIYWIVQDQSSPRPALPYNPLQQLLVGNVKKVPMVLGTNKNDGGLDLTSNRWLQTNVKNALKENNSTKLRKYFGLRTMNVSEEDVKIVNVMKRFYLSEGSYDDNEKNLIEMATDSVFASPAAEVTKLHKKVAPVFPYVLNERCTDLSFSVFYGGGDKDYGVAHADDANCIFHLFGTLTESGNMTSQAMIRSWTNFAKFENPSPYLSSQPEWPKGEMMFFESESGIKDNKTQFKDLLSRLMLWDKLYWEPLEDKVKVLSAVQQPSILAFLKPYNWFHTHNGK